MNHEISNKLHETLGGDKFNDHVRAKEFKTKGNDLQFRFPTKNGINMVKIELQENGMFLMKFYNYQPFRHIFKSKDAISNVPLERVRDEFFHVTRIKNIFTS